jgi:hypothetical protein
MRCRGKLFGCQMLPNFNKDAFQQRSHCKLFALATTLCRSLAGELPPFQHRPWDLNRYKGAFSCAITRDSKSGTACGALAAIRICEVSEKLECSRKLTPNARQAGESIYTDSQPNAPPGIARATLSGTWEGTAQASEPGAPIPSSPAGSAPVTNRHSIAAREANVD